MTRASLRPAPRRLAPGRGDAGQKMAVPAKLRRQTEDAAAWRDKCVAYFAAARAAKSPRP